MSARRRRLARALLLAAVASGVLGACGGADPLDPASRRSVPLEAAAALADAAERRVVEHHDAAALVERWVAEDDARLELAPGGEHALVLGDGARKLVLAGDFSGGRVTEAVLEVGAAEPELLRVALAREGRPVHIAPSIHLPAMGEQERPQEGALERHVIDLSEPGEGPFDAIWIVFAGDAREDVLRSVELARRSPAAFLPRPDAGPERVTIGRDTRNAQAVFAGGPRSAQLRPPRGARLEFAYGVPAPARGAGPRPVLEVRLSSPTRGKWVAARFEPWAVDGWGWASVPLEGLGGEKVEARFELVLPEGAAAPDETVGCAVSVPTVVVPRADPPTVLLVTSDTHRGDYLGATGEIDVATPALDALAARGVLFTNAYATANTTNPSHAAILTATHPRDTGIVDNVSPLSAEAPTLAEAFRDAGWTTLAATSASHLLPERSGFDQGFDRYAAPRLDEGPSFDAVAALTRWLPECSGRPLFVWLHVFDAHAPYEPPERYAELYYSGDPRSGTLSLPAHRVPYWARGVRDMRYLEALYRGEVSWVDERLSGLLDVARVANGVIAVTGDHGEHLGVEDGWFGHHLLYPDTLRVPLILAGPGVPAGVRTERRVHNMDLARTLLDLAGLGATTFPGVSLLHRLPRNAEEPPPRFAFSLNANSASVESGGWYLVLHLKEAGESRGRLPFQRHAIELFHLTLDPDCERDVSAQEPERARRMRAALVTFLTAARPDGWNVTGRETSDAERAELAGLGYTHESKADNRNEWIDPNCACARCLRWR